MKSRYLHPRRSYFSGKNVGLSSGLQETDIGSLFESVLSGNTAPAFNTVLKSMKPEALIIFLEPQVLFIRKF
jgi:hypothetical protein